jgi:CHAT domain-containing protein/tetratricopeptide (TPR) repeat protein
VRRPLLTVVAAATLVASSVCAQPASLPAAQATPSEATSTSAQRALDEAFAQLDRREFASALGRFSALVANPALPGPQRTRALRGLGEAAFRHNRLEQATLALARAFEAADKSGDRLERGRSRRLIGSVHYEQGRADEARAEWTAARDDFVAVGDLRDEFEVISDLTLLSRGLEQRPHVERCYAIAVALSDPLLEARARRRWGQSLLEAAKPGPALAELERAVELMRASGVSGQGYLGDALAVLGWAHRAHGAFERAAAVHREALRMAVAAGEVNAQIWNYYGLGISLTELRRFDQAGVAMRRGLAAARKTGSATSIRILAEGVPWVALRREDWPQALKGMEAVLALPGVEVNVTPYIHLCRAYRELGRIDEAIAVGERAVGLAREKGLVDNELRALIEMAQVWETRGDLTLAQQTLDGVIQRLEAYRSELAPSDFLKQGFGDSFADAYGVGVRVAMRRGQAAAALTAAERLRSRAFADLLAWRRQREADQAEAETGTWALGGPAMRLPAPGAVADSPRLVRALDSGALAALAAELETSLVVYWVQGTASYAWVVQPGGAVHGATLAASPSAIRRAVARASDAKPDITVDRATPAAASTRAVDRSPYRALHAMLWAPIEQWLPAGVDARITVIPHGPLFALPFGALLDARGRYVVERYALHYAASGAVLAEAAAPRRHVVATRHLLVADPRPLPRGPTGVHLPQLAGARGEARAIANLLGAGAELLVGREATEPVVREALGRARVVHFATHAVVSDTDPLGSHLLLAPAAGARQSSEGDGRLTAGEVAGLSVAADLVVLGACRSARGRVSSDGIAGLTRAFMAAGAPSVVATLWDVSDETTARVMTQFFAAYTRGVSKDRALRAAQLHLLRALRAGRVRWRAGATTVTFPEHPHLWAGAVLLGAP